MPSRKERARQLGVAIEQLPDERGKHKNHARGTKHHRWRQSIISSTGYVKVRVGRDHPLADPNGYAYEHLIVWVSAGNPRPKPHELLHHRNEDKLDNRIENIELVERSAHNAFHLLQDGRRDVKTGRLLPKTTNATTTT